MVIDILRNYAVKVAFFAALEDGDLEKMMERKDDEGKPIFDVEFSVNGVSLDFQKFVNHMVNSYDECVHDEAQNILEEKISGVMEKLQTMANSADEILANRT